MSAAGNPADPNLAQYDRWEIPDRAVRIYLNGAMAERLLADLASPEAARETGGILLGHIQPDGDWRNIFVEDLVPAPIGDSNNFEAALLAAALAACDTGAPPVLGYYRSESRYGLSLAAGDLALIESYFPEPVNLFMIVKPASDAEASRAGFFFREDVRVESGFRAFEVELGLPAVRPPRPARARSAWRGLLVRFAVIVLATAALVVAAIRYINAARPVHGSLGLQAVSRPSGLLVTWNPNAPVITHALRGVLAIRDGDLRKSLDLDKKAMSSGSVWYSPAANDIQFRLEVYDAGRQTAAQTVRVLRPDGKP